MRFIVMGDTHYIRADCHEKGFAGEVGGVTEVADLTRNSWLTRHHLPDVIEAIAALKPAFVIHTGDIVHGNCDTPRGAAREMREALALLEGLGAPTYFVTGSHDGTLGHPNDAPLRELLLPHLSRVLDRPLDRTWYAFEKQGSLFIVLDYATFRPDDDQATFIVETFRRSEAYEHVFVLAHPPLVPIGRPFFSSFQLASTLSEQMRLYPVDAYFCGHTHNQTASLHRIGEHWLTQLKSTVLGYRDRSPVPLADVRPLLPTDTDWTYGWGFLEDSAPGWWHLNIDGPRVEAEWHVLDRGVAGKLAWQRGEQPVFVQRPDFSTTTRGALPPLDSIQAVHLRAAGSGCRSPERYHVELNGQALGRLPILEHFDCRQRLVIAPDYWRHLQSHNRLRITTASEPMAIGAFVLEVATPDGPVRSSASDYYVNTSQWDDWQASPVHPVKPGATLELDLGFAPAGA